MDADYQYALRNINMSSELNGLYRTDIYELPTDCIREMICNAVAHRSYLHPSSIQVAVYDALKILREMAEAGILKKEGKKKGSYYKLK